MTTEDPDETKGVGHLEKDTIICRIFLKIKISGGEEE